MSTPPELTPKRKALRAARVAAIGSLLVLGSLLVGVVGLLTAFQLRRLYTEGIVRPLAWLIMRVCNVRVALHGAERLPHGQTVHISNHTSIVDGLVVLSLGLGNDIEGEGRDRSLLTFPQPQVELLAAVQKAIKEQNQNQHQRAQQEEKGAVVAADTTTGAFEDNP